MQEIEDRKSYQWFLLLQWTLLRSCRRAIDTNKEILRKSTARVCYFRLQEILQHETLRPRYNPRFPFQVIWEIYFWSKKWFFTRFDAYESRANGKASFDHLSK